MYEDNGITNVNRFQASAIAVIFLTTNSCVELPSCDSHDCALSHVTCISSNSGVLVFSSSFAITGKNVFGLSIVAACKCRIRISSYKLLITSRKYDVICK